MTKARRKAPPKGRTATKEFRRQQLIESTIDSIAKRGFAETTLANVAEGVGLSHGIVNFHFKSKEQLLIATLEFLAEEFRSVWARAVARAGPRPADKLGALIEANFHPTVCNRKKIAVWYAFWGEAKSRPTYLKLCDDTDEEYHEAVRGYCAEVIAEGGYEGLSAEAVASGLGAMTDGFWLDALLKPRAFQREEALETTQGFLVLLFPHHFPLTHRTAA